MSIATDPDFDVVVVGGGSVGLVFACLLDQYVARDGGGLRMAVLDQTLPDPEQHSDELELRVSALAPAAPNPTTTTSTSESHRSGPVAISVPPSSIL